MPRIPYLSGLIVGSLLLTACAEQGGDGTAALDGPVLPEHVTEVDPVALIGAWEVAETGETGEPGDHSIRLALGQLRVWRECGTVTGTWRAETSGLFVADTSGGSAGCTSAGEPAAPGWLDRASYFQLEGETPVLLDAQGELTARLLPGAELAPEPDLAASEVEPPEVTDEVREALAPAAPLPPELAPAGPDTLAGRWAPADAGSPAYLELAAGGDWQGFDGCNEFEGRWTAGSDGAIVAVMGPSTMMGCDNIPVGGWLAGAARAGLDGDVLVLFDLRGEEVGRLQPA